MLHPCHSDFGILMYTGYESSCFVSVSLKDTLRKYGSWKDFVRKLRGPAAMAGINAI